MSHIIEITDFSAPELQVYADLTHGDPFHCGSVFLAESEKVIQNALQASCRPISFLMERQNIGLRLPEQCSWIPIFTGSRQTIRQLTGYTLDRGFLCSMERPVCPDPDTLYHSAQRIVILRNISDPTDLGAVFRSAAALGIDAILIGEGCCDPLYRRAVRVSMGTVFQIPWSVLPDNPSIPDSFSCVTVTPCSGKPLDPSQWADCKKLAIVLDGGENADAYSIPLSSNAEPLNLAAASAVLFWMLRKP